MSLSTILSTQAGRGKKSDQQRSSGDLHLYPTLCLPSVYPLSHRHSPYLLSTISLTSPCHLSTISLPSPCHLIPMFGLALQCDTCAVCTLVRTYNGCTLRLSVRRRARRYETPLLHRADTSLPRPWRSASHLTVIIKIALALTFSCQPIEQSTKGTLQGYFALTMMTSSVTNQSILLPVPLS